MDTHSTKPSHAAVGYVGAVLVVGLAVFLGLGLNVVMPKVNVLLVLMLAVLLVSSRGGLGPSLLACLLVVSAFNYFFTEPIYSLKMAHRSDVATLVFFVIMAVFTANLAMRMQRERDGAERAARHAQNLYGLSRRLAAANDAVTVYQAVVEHLAATFPCAVLVRDAQGRVVAVAGPNALLERLQSGAVEPDITLTLEERRGAVTLFACMAEQEQAMGRTGLEEEHALARAVRDQAMVTLERIHLNDALEETRLGAETERLRNALLASLSHDLRTPLASVIGSLSTVRDCGPGIDSATRDDLLLTAEHEAERLDRYIQNLLDMTRIEHGTLRLQRDWTDPGDLVSAAVRRIEAANPGREVTIHLERSVPLIFVHGALIETVLVNLLDNAMRHAPGDSMIHLVVQCRDHGEDGEGVEFDVIDAGPGIPEAERQRVFDRFFTGTGSDDARHGSGLGLAICAALVAAHGGEIEALPGERGVGTRMRVSLPVAPPGTSPPGEPV